MKRNMGTLDRVVRTVVVAPVLLALGMFVFQFGSLFSIVALLLAAIMLVTSSVGYCPNYTLLGISTLRRHAEGPGELRVAAQH